jgi:hypothetical protein
MLRYASPSVSSADLSALCGEPFASVQCAPRRHEESRGRPDARTALVEAGEEAGGAAAVGVVLGAKLREQQGFLGADARDEKRDQKHDE